MPHLFWGGADCVELAARFGTPLYVLDESVIRARCAEVSQYPCYRFEQDYTKKDKNRKIGDPQFFAVIKPKSDVAFSSIIGLGTPE